MLSSMQGFNSGLQTLQRHAMEFSTLADGSTLTA
jgi:hypothetical protein